jgi:hypothetical protein
MSVITRLAAMSSGGRLSLLAIAAATLLAGCGGDDPTIPAAQGEDLMKRLDEVEGAVAEGKCDGAQASADLFVQQVGLLPASVDDEVKQGLMEGGERLQQLATEQCEEADTGATGESGFVPPEEATEEPPIEPPTDDETRPPTDEETQPPDGDEGGDEGQGQGQNDGSNAGGNQGGGTGPGTGGVGGGD